MREVDVWRVRQGNAHNAHYGMYVRSDLRNRPTPGVVASAHGYAKVSGSRRARRDTR